jgi:hypothetical protein
MSKKKEVVEVEEKVAEVVETPVEVVESEIVEVVEEVTAQTEEEKQSEVDARIKAENANAKAKAKAKSPSFTFAKGTVLFLGTQKITLTEDSEVFFDAAANEQLLAGILTVAGQLDINQDKLKANYDGNGVEIVADDGIDEQAV